MLKARYEKGNPKHMQWIANDGEQRYALEIDSRTRMMGGRTASEPSRPSSARDSWRPRTAEELEELRDRRPLGKPVRAPHGVRRFFNCTMYNPLLGDQKEASYKLAEKHQAAFDCYLD